MCKAKEYTLSSLLSHIMAVLLNLQNYNEVDAQNYLVESFNSTVVYNLKHEKYQLCHFLIHNFIV